jgi:tRNA(adenine34) deaminase
LNEAEIALKEGRFLGAVIVVNNTVMRSHNLTELFNDVTAHAEMQTITAAANYLGGKYFNRLYALCNS